MAGDVDRAKYKEFAGRVQQAYVGASVTFMIDLGYKTRLFEALAEGPATSEELAERAGLSERHVREWLGSMATAAITDYDAATGRHSLPPERVALLTGDGPTNLASAAQSVSTLGRHIPAVADTFREGGGLPYDVYRPEFTQTMSDGNWRRYRALLVRTYVPLAEGLPERLGAGANAVDIGCGTGKTTNLLAAAFPRSTFLGVDIAPDAIELARKEAADEGLTNVSFEVQDILTLDPDPLFDVVFAFDVVHDQVDPHGVLRKVHDVTAPDGRFFCVDIKAHTDLADNLSDPKAPMIYAMSTLHCMQVSLAHGGAGLGTAWGCELAESMLRDAGFASVTVKDLPADPFNVAYDCRK